MVSPSAEIDKRKKGGPLDRPPTSFRGPPGATYGPPEAVISRRQR